MKRIIALLLSLIMVLSLCACGKKNLTLEDLTSMYVQYDDTRVTFSFEDGTMSVKVIHYVESASSPSGKIAGKEEKYTIPYALDGKHYITVDGVKYHYDIDTDKEQVNFSVEFMDLEKTFNYV